MSHQHPLQTQGFHYAHTMIRVKDAEASVKFYRDILGMSVIRHSDYEGGKFSLIYLCYLAPDEIVPTEKEPLAHWMAARSGILELTHNWGTEHDADFSYQTGNGENGGYGHIAISVPDFDAAIAWFDKNQVPFKKRPEDGNMKNIAFIKDPDEYWIEIIHQ